MTNKQANRTLSFILTILILCFILVYKIAYRSGYEKRVHENDHWDCEYKWEGKNMDEMSVKCLRVMGIGSNLPDTK